MSNSGKPRTEGSIDAPAPDSCSPNRRKILSGARDVFTEVGFDRASVDAIAARAGVARATVYNHFEDKAELFVAAFSDEAHVLRTGFLACLTEPRAAPGTGGPAAELAGPELERAVEAELQQLGEKLVTTLLSPPFVALYRHTSAESARFPAIGRTLFERGPGVVYQTIAAYLTRWQERGALHMDEPEHAAVQLAALWQGSMFLRAQLGVLEQPADEEIRATVGRGVRVFLLAYGRPGG